VGDEEAGTVRPRMQLTHELSRLSILPPDNGSFEYFAIHDRKILDIVRHQDIDFRRESGRQNTEVFGVPER